MKPCIVIPVFNHGSAAGRTVAALARYKLTIIVVNDGSDRKTTEILRRISEENDLVTLVERSENGGKGAAVMTGLLAASDRAFSHALQIDADGQHDTDDVERFLAASRADPEAMVVGRPIFDETVPRGRLIGR